MPEHDSINKLLASARSGDVQAMYDLAEAYANGTLVRKDDGQALLWYRRAAELGHADATSDVGKMYFLGRGVPQDDKEALAWIQKAVELGSVKAQSNLGVFYYLGRAIVKDLEEARKWFTKAADSGDSIAMYNLGRVYREQDNIREAIRWFEKSAELDYVNAMTSLGFIYFKGECVKQDLEQAMKWFLRAGEAGDWDALSNVGAMYGRGQGVAKDEDEAMKCYLRSAEGGSLNAMLNLVRMYRGGNDRQGEFRDPAKAIGWCRKAAALEDTEAMETLGVMYANGEGCERNLAQAIYWFAKAADKGGASATRNTAAAHQQAGHRDQALRWSQKAADAGDAEGMYQLAELLSSGKYFIREPLQAAEWYKKAAATGLAKAMYRYGMMVGRGQWVTRNVSEAVTWLRQAVESGVDETAGEYRLLTEIYGVERGLEQDASPDAKSALEAINLARRLSVEQPEELPAQLYARACGPTAGRVRAAAEAFAGSAGKPWLAALAPFPEPQYSCIGTLPAHAKFVSSIVFLDEDRVLSVSEDGRMLILDSTGRGLIGELSGHVGPVNHASLSSDQKWIVTSGDDKTIKIWDAKTSQLVNTLEGHTDFVRKALMTSTGLVVSAGSDQTVRVWDFQKGTLLRTMEGHKAWVCTLAVSPDGKRAVSVSLDSAMLVWDLETGNLIKTIVENATYSEIEIPELPPGSMFSGPLTIGGENNSGIGHRNYPHAAVWLGIDKLITASQEIIVWDASNFSELKRIEGDPQGIEGIALFDNNRRIISVGSAIRVHDLESGTEMACERGDEQNDLHSVGISPSETRIASGDKAGWFKVWDLGRLLGSQRRFGHASSALHIAVSPNEKIAATAGFDKQVVIWDTATGKPLRRLKEHRESATFVAGFRNEGRQLVTASQGELLIWDASNGGLLRKIERKKAELAGVGVCSFFDNGQRLLTGSMSYQPALWDLEKGDVEAFSMEYCFYGEMCPSNDELHVLCATYPSKLLDPKFDEKGVEVFELPEEDGKHTPENESRVSPAVLWSYAEKKIVQECWPPERELPSNDEPETRCYPTFLIWSANESQVIVSWPKGTVCMYDRLSGRLLQSFDTLMYSACAQQIKLLFITHEGKVGAVRCGEDSRGQICFWKYSKGKWQEARSFSLPRQDLGHFAISCDARLLVAAQENILIMIEALTGKEVCAITLPTKIMELYFRRRIYTTGEDGLLYIFDFRMPSKIESGKLKAVKEVK